MQCFRISDTNLIARMAREYTIWMRWIIEFTPNVYGQQICVKCFSGMCKCIQSCIAINVWWRVIWPVFGRWLLTTTHQPNNVPIYSTYVEMIVLHYRHTHTHTNTFVLGYLYYSGAEYWPYVLIRIGLYASRANSYRSLFAAEIWVQRESSRWSFRRIYAIQFVEFVVFIWCECVCVLYSIKCV